MAVVNFGVSSSEGPTIFVEAHGYVYQPEDFSDLITEITEFYVSYEDEEDSEWMEIDETFLTINLGEHAFMELISQIEFSLLEDYYNENERNLNHDRTYQH
jgi:hypothetical protein